jgi:AraC family transcriptional regulator of adaptative response / DNA-3-methyladenine glycosylase II
MLERFLARDPRGDGRYLVGVLSTGIYCLPSCPARRPKPENVRFFADEAAARASGLRACKRCRPDAFLRRSDPDLDLVAELAARVRAAPGEVADAAALARTAGVGATKLAELFRRHLHASPAAFLARARVERAARTLLERRGSVLAAGLDAGFESQSAFHENFRRWQALSPGAYRRLAEGRAFALALPADFRADEVRAMFARDRTGVCERADASGKRLAKALVLDGRPWRLAIELGARRARCELVGPGRAPSARAMADAHAVAVRLLGLAGDPGPFERATARRGLARLVAGRRGLRVPEVATAFEGLVWVVLGQQIQVSFAATLRARLIRLCGLPAGEDMVAHPLPADVAALAPADLVRLSLSRRKAEYLIDAARAIAAGELDLEGLRHEPVARVERTLAAVRGLGPWSVQYLAMRAYGLEDCVPAGDSGLATALQRFHGLDARPDARATVELMRPFAPHRSLATFHLWKTLGDPA